MNVKQFLIELFTDENLQNYKPRHPRVLHFMKHFVIVELLTVAMMAAYIEIGHDRGWNRAEVWYTCLHTHKHFPWQ